MGCWNETCFITGASIKGGDPIVMFIVQQASNPGIVGESWRPVSFPIIGRYDEYGGIEKPDMIFEKQFVDCWKDLFARGIIKISERGETMSKYEEIGLVDSKEAGVLTFEQILHQIEREYLEFNSDRKYFDEGKLDVVLAHKEVYDFLIANYYKNQDKYNFRMTDKSMLEKVKDMAEIFTPDRDDAADDEIFKKHGFFLDGELLKGICGWYGPALMPHLAKAVLKHSKDHELIASAMQELETLYIAMMELRRPIYTHGTGKGSQQDNTRLKVALSKFEHSFFSERLKKDEEDEDWEDEEAEDEES